MSYRVRFTTQTGATGYWDGTFATHTGASMSAQTRADVTGYTYTVEEVPEPGSMAAHHVEILRERIKELEAVQKAMSRDLAFALQIGDALRQAMRTGEWRAGHDRNVADSATSGWDRWKTSLAASFQGTAKASEAPGEDSDRRRLEALERYLEGDTFREVWKTSMGPFAAGTKFEGQHFDAPTLAALADKLAEASIARKDKPPTLAALAALADKLAEMEAKP